MEQISFNAEELKELEAIKSRYPNQQAALMPALWMAQKKFGWLSDEVQQYVADLFNLPVNHVKGVATFYTMYFKKPAGKYHVQVCTNVSCMIRGGERLLEKASEKLNISHGETTPDGKFSLEEVECMGACGGAPMIAVGEDYYENYSVERLEALLEELRNKEDRAS